MLFGQNILAFGFVTPAFFFAGLALLGQGRAALDAAPQWDAAVLEAALAGVAEAAGVGLGKVAQPLRAALTGRATSPGIYDVLLLLGRPESIGRIDDRLAATPA